jgi:hypothetical protein
MYPIIQPFVGDAHRYISATVRGTTRYKQQIKSNACILPHETVRCEDVVLLPLARGSNGMPNEVTPSSKTIEHSATDGSFRVINQVFTTPVFGAVSTAIH